jgi:hypothetical protein
MVEVLAVVGLAHRRLCKSFGKDLEVLNLGTMVK